MVANAFFCLMPNARNILPRGIINLMQTDATPVLRLRVAKVRTKILEMWANAQPDGRPAEYR